MELNAPIPAPPDAFSLGDDEDSVGPGQVAPTTQLQQAQPVPQVVGGTDQAPSTQPVPQDAPSAPAEAPAVQNCTVAQSSTQQEAGQQQQLQGPGSTQSSQHVAGPQPPSVAAATPSNDHRRQPQDLTTLLAQLSDNAEAIAAAEEVLEGLLARQATLHHMGRKMEQHRVLQVLQGGHLGFHRGRPVAAVLLYRCLLHWGLLHQTEQCPFLEQLAAVLQAQLDLEDASAPADVAGLQCHVANSLTVCAVLYCVLLKACHPQLAAAAAAEQRGPPKQLHTAAEVVAAARKKVSATLQQGVAHMGPGLQALGKLKISGWGFKRSEDAAAPGSATANSSSSSSSQAAAAAQAEHPETAHAAAAAHPAEASAAATGAGASPAPPAGEPGSPSAAPAEAAAAPADGRGATAAAVEGSLQAAAPFDAFLLCLDQLVQHAYSLLRDQLKRRLTPLLADCISPDENNAMGLQLDADQDSSGGLSGGGSGQQQQPQSPGGAGAAVAGSAAESAAHAEAALMNYRSWSELVGVLHAALVALRSAHVPRALRATLMQQVLEFVNCQLFNQLLLRPECCSVSNARYALRGLKQLDTWILAEQSAHHASSHHHEGGGRPSWRHASAHAVAGAGSIHSGGSASGSGSFNSSQVAAAAPAGDAAAGAVASKLGGGYSGSSGADGRGGGAGAKLSAGEEEDGGWEQVPADMGEFDAWQPPRQQQQHWWRPKQQQQQGAGPGEQPELGPEAWDALAHVRQALQFLVLDSKGALSLQDLTDHVCPALNHQQLYRLCTTAWTEAPDAADGSGGGVSGEVLEQMKQQYTLSGNGGLIVTFLLDEPVGPLPFAQEAPVAAVAAAGGSSGGCRCRLGSVVLWDDGRDYGAGLRPVPGALVDEGCPGEVFEFVTRDLPWPPGSRHAGPMHG